MFRSLDHPQGATLSKDETCRSDFKSFSVFQCVILWKCICWLTIKVILRNAWCNDEKNDENVRVYKLKTN